MESVLGRYRNLTILVGILFLQVLGLAVQVKRGNDAEHTRLIRIWAVDAITPLERSLIWVQSSTNNLWHNYFFLRGVRAENRRLKEQIEQMRLEQVRLSEDAAQARRLQSLLAFKEQIIAKTVPAQVIGSSASDLSRSIYIDKGSDQGIAPDMPVITAGGVVGKVLRVYPSTSLVLMINDQTSGVGVLLEKSRLQGVLRGTMNGELVVERVMSDEQVSPGEAVLSSGGDQIFPKGLPVGTVSEVHPGREMFLNVKIKAAADLSRLEEVLVITEKQELSPAADIGTKVRAADILAQRLPSVPEKPAVIVGGPSGSSAASGTASPTLGGAQPAQKEGAKQQSGSSAKPANQQATNSSTSPAGARPNVAARAPGIEPSTKSVEKTNPENLANGGSSASGPSTRPTSLSNPTNSPAKSAAVPPKPANMQAAPHAPAAEDSPH